MLTVGPALPGYLGVNQDGLFADPVTDPPAYGEPNSSAGDSGVPTDSPWGEAVVFPEVPYATIMDGGAAQPTLQLPQTVFQKWSSALKNGLTFQTWFQAKSPGVLLSETLTVNGVETQVPLIYINSQGDLVAGLFDGTSLPFITGQTILSWTGSGGAVQIGAANPVVSQMSVIDNTWHHLAFVVSGQSEALYLDGMLQGVIQPESNSSYSFIPTLSGGGIPVTGPSAFTMGGTIVPEPTAVPDPQINYPQGFVGTIDEVAAWTRMLTQPQVQEAMTAPISRDKNLTDRLVAYFDFDVPPINQKWRNDADGGQVGFAQEPTSGTKLKQVATTIPTDPFRGIKRLPGARDWGIDIITPFAASSKTLRANNLVAYEVGLDAGDTLEISVPDADQGTLTVQVESDLGTKTSARLKGGQTSYLVAARTGTFRLSLLWVPATGRISARQVTFSQIPGPLNNLMELLTSYKQQGANQVVYQWAYGDFRPAGEQSSRRLRAGQHGGGQLLAALVRREVLPGPQRNARHHVGEQAQRRLRHAGSEQQPEGRRLRKSHRCAIPE